MTFPYRGRYSSCPAALEFVFALNLAVGGLCAVVVAHVVDDFATEMHCCAAD